MTGTVFSVFRLLKCVVIIPCGLQHLRDHPLGTADILPLKDMTDFLDNQDGSDSPA